MPRRKRRSTQLQPTAKPQTSDQAPGEETVQVNDQYKGGGPAASPGTREHAQHQTGGEWPKHRRRQSGWRMVCHQRKNLQQDKEKAAAADHDSKPAPPSREPVDHEQDGEEDD